jgi:hypothetical protein
MKTKVKMYCREARKNGYTARDAMVLELLSLPSHKWGFKYSDTEIAIASRIQWESK